jgi:hypothetical protein
VGVVREVPRAFRSDFEDAGSPLLVAQDHAGFSPGQDAGAATLLREFFQMPGRGWSHGPGVDLGPTKFKTGSTDEDLVRIVISGVPGTGMPSNVRREEVSRADRPSGQRPVFDTHSPDGALLAHSAPRHDSNHELDRILKLTIYR